MMRQKRLGCVYMQDLSDLVGYWLIKGVCLEVRMLRNFWKVEVVGYSECNRVLQVDKRVSTEMSVSFCGLTCDFSKMIPLMVERKY